MPQPLTLSVSEVHRRALTRYEEEKDWGELVRPHVILMSGEHAFNAERLIDATGGAIVEKQVNRDQTRYLVKHGFFEYNVLVSGLGAESVESALREYYSALKKQRFSGAVMIRLGSAGGISSRVGLNSSFIVNTGFDLTGATTFSHKKRTSPLPKIFLGRFIPFLRRHTYTNFGLSNELQTAADRLRIPVTTGSCASVGTFGHFVMSEVNGRLVPLFNIWRHPDGKYPSAVNTHAALLRRVKPDVQDMEAAALAALIHHAGLNIRYGAVLGISDHVRKKGEWHPFKPLINPFIIALKTLHDTPT